MPFLGLDPGDPNNWYQSPQLGLSPAGYGSGISGDYSAPYHPYGSSTCVFTQFSAQPNPYPPLQLNPSATIISGHLFPHQFPCVAQQPLTTTPRDPYIPTYHSPHSDPNPWIYPPISQRHSYDLSVTSVHSPFIFTKIMTTPPIYHSAPSIPTFQSPLVPTFVPQLPITDPKPLSLNHKSFRRSRHRVAMVAKARVAKKTRKPYMLPGVGKYSRFKMYQYHKCSLFPRHNSKVAVEIMEELGQLGVGRKTLINTSEPPAVQFGTLPTAGNTSSFSFPVTEPTDHSTPIQASAASSLPPSIDLQESIGSQLTGVHLEQAKRWTETCEIEADKEASDHHPLEKDFDASGGLKTLNSQFEVIVSPFDNYHLLRAVSTLLLKKKDRCNRLSASVSYHLSQDVLDHNSAFNIVGYNPFLNFECGLINSVYWHMSLPLATWLENIQRNAAMGLFGNWEALNTTMIVDTSADAFWDIRLNMHFFIKCEEPDKQCFRDAFFSSKFSMSFVTSRLLAFESSLVKAVMKASHATIALKIDSNSLSSNNDPLFVLSYNEKPIVKAPQVFIQISKTEGLFDYSKVKCTLVHDYLRRIAAWVMDSLLVTSTDRDSVNLLLKHIVTAIAENCHNAEFAIPQLSLVESAKQTNILKHLSSLEAIPHVLTKFVNSLEFTFSLIIALIELWSYGYVEKNMRWLIKISVTSTRNGCLIFHHDQGLISGGIKFNSFLVNRNDECIVVHCSNLLQRMSKLQLYVEVVHRGVSHMIRTSLSFKAPVDFSMCAISEFGTVATLNAWLNANFLLLPLENKWEKMTLSLADELEKMGHKKLLKRSAAVMFVSKDGKYLALGSNDGDIFVVEVKKMERELIALRNHISSQGVVNLLEEVSEFAFAKFGPGVILLTGLQGVGKTTVFTTLQMAFLLCQVALTCMRKLQDERFLFSGGFSYDNYACFDIVMAKQLPNAACHSILFRLILAILRQESSEALRRQQYAVLLSYFQYCQHMLDLDIPSTGPQFLQFLLLDEQEVEDLDLQKISREQAEVAHASFFILRKEAQSILDLVIKDSTQGCEIGETMSFYVLDDIICVDHERYFLGQLQNRGFLRSGRSYHDGAHSQNSMQQRAQTLELEFALLLRIKYLFASFMSHDEVYHACVEGREIISNLSIAATSKFLLNWLVQPEHEHHKWSAAISVGLISSGLYITDHKQKFEKCLGVVKSTLDALNIMQKSGFKRNYQCFLQLYLPYVSVGKAFTSLQHEHQIDPVNVKTVTSSVHQQEVPSSYSSVTSQEGHHHMERVVTKLNVLVDWKKWPIYLLLVGMFLAVAVAFYIVFEKSDNFWNFPLENYQRAGPEFGAIPKLCLLHNFCNYHINAPRHELGADVISSDFSLLNVDDLADQLVELVDFLGLKKLPSLGGDLHDEAGTSWNFQA